MTYSIDKINEARELYLRGFNGDYIRSHTNISIQSLLKTLRSRGEVYTKDDIFKRQLEYISENYTKNDVVNAYSEFINEFDDLEKASRGKHINVLNCGFGNYKRVFVEILGKNEYMKLRNKFWKQKQESTMIKEYGVDNIFRSETYSKFVSDEVVAKGRIKRTATMLDRYGVEHPNSNKDIAAKMVKSSKITNNKKYGVDTAMQLKDVAMKANIKRQQTMLDKYGYKNSVEIKSIRDKIFENRRKNKTLNTSNPEDALYEELADIYGYDDVFRNIVVDDRYPYHVDFYIKSLDLFIELNGDRCHNTHWFDSNNIDDVNMLNHWIDRQKAIEQISGKNSRYRQFIKTWTVTDVAKRNKAKDENLNYLVFWDGTSSKRNGKPVAKLSDFYEWLEDGQPMPTVWKKHNTY